MTAKEFLKEENLNKVFESKPNNYLETILIEFAKIHCKAQAEAICENVKTKTQKAIFVEGSWNETIVDKDSILTAYPLENIV